MARSGFERERKCRGHKQETRERDFTRTDLKTCVIFRALKMKATEGKSI